MKIIFKAVSIVYLIKPIFQCILPILVFKYHLTLPRPDICAILLCEPLIFLLRPIHFDRVSIPLDVQPVADPRSHLLLLERWLPIAERRVRSNNPHLLVRVLKWVKNRKADRKFFPDVLDLYIFVAAPDRDHFFKNFVVKE